MAETTKRYRAPKFSIQVPRLDEKGKPTSKNVLAIGGGRHTYLLTEAEAAPFVKLGSLELVRESEPEGEAQDGPPPAVDDSGKTDGDTKTAVTAQPTSRTTKK